MRGGMDDGKLLQFDGLSFRVIGAAIEVHRALGPGFRESVYDEALALELGKRGIDFVRKPALEVYYLGQKVGYGRPDFIVGGVLVVELKAVECLLPVHVGQVISYLKIGGGPMGLLLNFRAEVIRKGIKRVVL